MARSTHLDLTVFNGILAPMRLYDADIPSGNGYKVQLLLEQLGLAYDYIEIDLRAGETHTPAFLERNPAGKIPVLELDDGTYLCESNAILCFLAGGTPFLPADRIEHARVLQWLFFEQYSHEPNIAVLKFWALYGDLASQPPSVVEQKRAGGNAALALMQQHLAEHTFFAAGRYTVADIALYAYTHRAGVAGFDLDAYPAVKTWLDAVRRQPGHVEQKPDRV